MISSAFKGSEELSLASELTLVSREPLADFSCHFTEPEGQDSCHDLPTQGPY
jgi:hypothetical protein